MPNHRNLDVPEPRALLEKWGITPGKPPIRRHHTAPAWTPARPSRTVTPKNVYVELPEVSDTFQLQPDVDPNAVTVIRETPSSWHDEEEAWFGSDPDTMDPAPSRAASGSRPVLRVEFALLAAAMATVFAVLTAAGAIVAALTL